MSGSDRHKRSPALTVAAFCALALIGAGVLLYLIGALNGRQAERRHQAPADYSQAAKADAERSCVGREPSAAFECIYEKVESSQDQARAEQDLSAQQRAADSALASALIALLTFIITAIGVWFVKRTLDATLEAVKDTGEATVEMRRSNDIAQDVSVKQLRAYIDYRSAKIVAEADSSIIEVELTNAGQTPARKIMSACHGYMGVRDLDAVFHIILHQTLSTTTAFPDLAHGASVKIQCPIPPLDDARRAKIIAGDDAVYLMTICNYEDVFGNAWITQSHLICTGDDFARGIFRVHEKANQAT